MGVFKNIIYNIKFYFNKISTLKMSHNLKKMKLMRKNKSFDSRLSRGSLEPGGGVADPDNCVLEVPCYFIYLYKG